MELSIQEVHSYLNLVDQGKANKINCPFDETDIVIAKIDENDKVCFYCLSCRSNFYLGINSIKKIQSFLK